MILEVFAEHNKQLKELVGHDFAPVTLIRYHTSLNHTCSSIERKFGLEDMEINILNYDSIFSYSFWLETVWNCNNNTTVKYLHNFKKIVLHCVRNK